MDPVELAAAILFAAAAADFATILVIRAFFHRDDATGNEPTPV